MRYVAGVDPGLSGAVAVLTVEGEVVAVLDTPTVAVAGQRRDYYVPAMVDILREYAPDRVWIERQQAYPKQGVASTFKTGMGFGLWLGIAAGLGLSHEVVSPQSWQREMYQGSVGDGKDRSLLVAARLWPGLQIPKTRHGRADALLIAEYGRRRTRAATP